MTTYYTMIGSRSTPDDVLGLMTELAYKLALWGWVGRSGAADGADTCLEDGVHDFLCTKDKQAKDYIEVYLPWKDFNGRSSSVARGFYTLSDLANRGKAETIAETLHPNWNACKQGAKKLHTRNVYQLLGQDLNTPSRFVICYAEPKGKDGNVKGGTGTAVKLAIDNGIDVFNMYLPEHRKRIEDWINKEK